MLQTYLAPREMPSNETFCRSMSILSWPYYRYWIPSEFHPFDETETFVWHVTVILVKPHATLVFALEYITPVLLQNLKTCSASITAPHGSAPVWLVTPDYMEPTLRVQKIRTTKAFSQKKTDSVLIKWDATRCNFYMKGLCGSLSRMFSEVHRKDGYMSRNYDRSTQTHCAPSLFQQCFIQACKRNK